MAIDRYTIKLKSYLDVFVEKKAHDAFYPGALLLLNSDDEFAAHNDDAPANCVPVFAIEDALQGKGIDDKYAAGDWVRGWIPTRGDVVYVIVEDGTHVAIGDFLESAGDSGYLQKYTSGKAIAVALEHIDLSGSSGEDTSESPLGFAKRIQAMII